MSRRSWRVLIGTAALTALWACFVVLARGYAGAGVPLAWRPSHSCVVEAPRYGYLVLDIALWFALFYAAVRGFLLMQRSPFRRPFRWRPPRREL